MEELINGPISELKDDFWVQINEPLKSELTLIIQNCRGILLSGFQAKEEEVSDFVDDFLKQIRRFTTDFIRKLFKDINSNLARRFKDEFQNDETGTQRNWVALEEHAIKELSVKARDSVLYVVQRFKYIEVDYDEIAMLATGPTSGDPQSLSTPAGTPGEILEQRARNPSRSPTLIYDKLLSEVELNKVRDRFKEEVKSSLEEALRKHVSTSIFTL
jgi:hypothetical protein